MSSRSIISGILLVCLALFSGVEIGSMLNLPRLDEVLSGTGILGTLLAFYLRGRDQ